MGPSDDIKAQLNAAWCRADQLIAPLNERIAVYVAASRELRPEVMAAYDRFVADLRASGVGDGAPGLDEVMPDFMLPNQDGMLVALAPLLEHGPLVVSFNRGHWCPYCRLELRTLARAHPDLLAAGARTVSIVPEVSAYTAAMCEANDLPFEVLSDMDLEYTRIMGLAIDVPANLQALYVELGIDLPLFQRTSGWSLPLPATIVVGMGGLIKARFVDADFRVRMDVEDIRSGIEEC